MSRRLNDHLRSHVFDCTTERCGQLVVVVEDLAEAEVDEFDVTFGVQHDVFGLEVAVDDVDAVKVFQGAHDFAQIESAKKIFELGIGFYIVH